MENDALGKTVKDKAKDITLQPDTAEIQNKRLS